MNWTGRNQVLLHYKPEQKGLAAHTQKIDGDQFAWKMLAPYEGSIVSKKKPARRLTKDRLDGIVSPMVRADPNILQNSLLDAAEAVVARQGIANLTLDAVAAEAGMSKGGLLHYFPSKDLLVEAMVVRTAENWRGCYMCAYERTPQGPGRMARALLDHCLSDAQGWTAELQRSSSACFAALAQNPSLIEPMRAVYSDLHQRVAEDGLPPGVGEAVAAAIDGLWLYWVLGLATVDQDLVVRVRRALEDMLARSQPNLPSPDAQLETKHFDVKPSGEDYS